mgnify:CR=1 FL=1
MQCHVTRSVTAVDSSFGLFTCPYLAVTVMCLCACARRWLRFKISGVSTLQDVQQKVAVVSLSSLIVIVIVIKLTVIVVIEFTDRYLF